MIIERDKESIIIKLNPAFITLEQAQKAIDYLRLIESNAQNQGTQEQADELARESHKDWLRENQHRLSK